MTEKQNFDSQDRTCISVTQEKWKEALAQSSKTQDCDEEKSDITCNIIHRYQFTKFVEDLHRLMPIE